MDEDPGSDDSVVALKLETPPCKWEFYICEVLLGRLQDQYRTARFTNVKQLYLSQEASFMITDLGDSGTLHELLNMHRVKGQVTLLCSLLMVHIMKCYPCTRRARQAYFSDLSLIAFGRLSLRS